MIRWQPPPADAQNGEIIGYKIRYRKGTRKSEVAEITSGSQLYQLIDGKLMFFTPESPHPGPNQSS
jgi:neogenin